MPVNKKRMAAMQKQYGKKKGTKMEYMMEQKEKSKKPKRGKKR